MPEYKVRVTVERVVEAEMMEDAVIAVCDPIRGAFEGKEVGIVEVSAVSMDPKLARLRAWAAARYADEK